LVKEFDKIEKARSVDAEDGWINIKLLQALDLISWYLSFSW